MFCFDQRNAQVLVQTPEQAVTGYQNAGLLFDSWKSLPLQLMTYKQYHKKKESQKPKKDLYSF